MPEGEQGQALLDQRPHCLRAELAADVGLRFGAHPGPQVGVVEQLGETPRSVLDVGLRPQGACRVDADRCGERLEFVADREGVFGRHEIHVGGPAGGDHRLAQIHHFRRRQAETLTPVQGEQDVATGLQVPDLLAGEEFIDEYDVGEIADAAPQFTLRFGMVLAIDCLDDQRDIGTSGRRPAECRQGGLRVLAILVGMEVVHDQHQQLVVRQVELATPQPRAGGELQGMRYFYYRDG